MSKFAVLLLPLFLAHTPHTCRAQPLSGAPLIKATKNLLPALRSTVESANVNATRTQNEIKEFTKSLRDNATFYFAVIQSEVLETLAIGAIKLNFLNGLAVDEVTSEECRKPTSLAESDAAKILQDAHTCVSDTIDSIEIKSNDTISSIESILAKINSDQNLTEVCMAEYDKTEMALRHAVISALCVTQAKQRILSAVNDELTPLYDTKFLKNLSIDADNRLTNCYEKEVIADFRVKALNIFDGIIDCVKNSVTTNVMMRVFRRS